MILDSLHIEFEVVDIAGAAMEEAKEFMRTNGKKKDNQRHVLPPQIFNGDKYCGVSRPLYIEAVDFDCQKGISLIDK